MTHKSLAGQRPKAVVGVEERELVLVGDALEHERKECQNESGSPSGSVRGRRKHATEKSFGLMA